MKYYIREKYMLKRVSKRFFRNIELSLVSNYLYWYYEHLNKAIVLNVVEGESKND